ncbi:gliding motility-associated ABC transporter substrate-binding protein GldG [Mucilaginibacter sp. PPCGB 2223]|uniref:gliding motility-associated ABC transporter substrate-binding protein GldG n=1 Tax=Mucilaginibacter sp. PPCGB 2223 TaxID=1886027 RepID=UPI000826913A|nr:gliding motility-associated ABC transporter substrate-binding protein GldG [Mucilaginibacter sp. PPCGB 2223]OCX52353.1 gliding motility-associated ABC transporter substrate-binding protein GldG [Mucilaginibacter sp. PPCGB 2223]
MVNSRKKKDLLQLLLFFVALVVVNLLSGKVFTRFDFTREKRYTLSAVSRNLVDSLTRPVTVTVYLQGSELPPAFKRLQTATRDMLTDMQAYSYQHIRFEFIDPLGGLTEQQQNDTLKALQAKGLDITALSVKTDNGLTQKTIVPSALVSCDGKEIPVKLLQTRIGLSDEEQLNNSIQNLEYAFASAIKRAASTGKQSIGFTEGHSELSDRQLNDAIKSLSDGFVVGRVNLKTIPFSSMAAISLLVIPKPDKPFTELEKFKIDQYLMRGGRILWTIDQVSAELDSLRGKGGEQLAFNKQLNLDDQLFRYGIRINYDLVADMSCAQIPLSTGNVGGQSQYQMVPWLFYPIFIPKAKHPIVKNLDGIRTEFVSTIDTLPVKGIKKTVLLESTPYNRKLSTPHLLSLQMVEDVPDPKTFQSAPKTVGVLLEGSFTSDFKNRPLPDSLKEHVDVIVQSKQTKMIVISDGDVFKNQVASDGFPYPMDVDKYNPNNRYGNKNLLLNIADYMTDDSGLIALRNKEIQLRLLDKARIRSEKLYWQVINNVIPVALVLIFAIFQHYTRKRKYAR